MRIKSCIIITLAISIFSLIPSPAFAESGILDQSNGPGKDSSQIRNYEPCGQEFVPTMPSLCGIGLFIYSSMNANGNTTININIRPDSITNAPMGSQSFVIPSNYPKTDGGGISEPTY